MENTSRLDELLSRWQRAADAGRPTSAEELCADSPELLDEVRRRIDVLAQVRKLARKMNAETVSAAGPRSAVEPTEPAAVPAEPAEPAEPPLPEVPGYEVVGRLGKGGMGVVYQARDPRLRRDVALKMIRDRGLDADGRRRLLGEAQAAARLNHPHIVQLYALGEHAGQPYLVMELVRGTTLQDRLAGRACPPRDAARTVLLLARAVQAAHDQQIIHRDLKPGNVLLAEPAADEALNCAWGCPKVSDFGLARRLDAEDGLSHTGDVAGTPSYMAPEQALGQRRDIGPATDVYALGAILYALLTGRPPFRGAAFSAILDQVLHADPVPPRRVQPDTPRDLETVCLKCLRKEPGRRYASARELADDLDRLLRGEAIRARPVGWPERAAKWARRQPLAAGLLAGVVLLVLVALGLLGHGWAQAERTRELEAGRADYEKRQREQAERQLARNRVLLADRDLAAGQAPWAEATLRQVPPELRQWEWRHLMYRCRQPELPVLRAHRAGVSCVAAGPPDGRFASAAGDGLACLWEPGPPGPARLLRGHLGGVNWVAFTRHGDELLSGGEDGHILLWDAATGERRGSFDEHRAAISCIAVHPSEPWAASATFGGPQPGEILLWHRETRQVLHRLTGHTASVSGLAFSPDGSVLASASHDHAVMLWDAQACKPLSTFKEHRLPVSCVAFAPDGTVLASASGRLGPTGPDEAEVLLWDAETGAVRRRLTGHRDRVVALAFSPDGRRLATGGWDKAIKLWDTDSGEEVLTLTGPQDTVTSVAFTPDGRLISGSLDQTVRVWPAPAAGGD